MIRLPRLALATPPEGPEPSAASLAMMAGLGTLRRRVQHFRARACPTGNEAVGEVTGLPGRHLDAWLMPDDVVRCLFAKGARLGDLALVEGTLDEPVPGVEPACVRDRPGRLGPIAEALDLPILAVVPCRSFREFHLPRLPRGTGGVLLDGLESPADFEPIRRMFELVPRLPVVGAIEALPEARAALADAPRDQPPTEALDRLTRSFLRFVDLPALDALAESRPFPEAPEPDLPRRGRPFRVAYARDEAFGGYFPDTRETLSALGAEMVEFSPLRDESLPANVDLVFIGCGFPDRHAEALAANISLITALRAHVCRGHRIYSEGGGTAYLGRALILPDRVVPGAQILPFEAELKDDPAGPSPVSRTLTQDGWLGPKGTVVRGYRSGRWRLRPAAEPDDCPAKSGVLTAQGDIYFRRDAVGGLIHLHLAALPQVVAAFAGCGGRGEPRPSAGGSRRRRDPGGSR